MHVLGQQHVLHAAHPLDTNEDCLEGTRHAAALQCLSAWRRLCWCQGGGGKVRCTAAYVLVVLPSLATELYVSSRNGLNVPRRRVFQASVAVSPRRQVDQ